MAETIPITIDGSAEIRSMGALPGEEFLHQTSTSVVRVATEAMTESIAKVVRSVADMLAKAETEGTGWALQEATISLAVDANGEASLWAVKGQAGAKASLDITLRRS